MKLHKYAIAAVAAALMIPQTLTFAQDVVDGAWVVPPKYSGASGFMLLQNNFSQFTPGSLSADGWDFNRYPRTDLLMTVQQENGTVLTFDLSGQLKQATEDLLKTGTGNIDTGYSFNRGDVVTFSDPLYGGYEVEAGGGGIPSVIDPRNIDGPLGSFYNVGKDPVLELDFAKMRFDGSVDLTPNFVGFGAGSGSGAGGSGMPLPGMLASLLVGGFALAAARRRKDSKS